jgi:hypothetical protein
MLISVCLELRIDKQHRWIPRSRTWGEYLTDDKSSAGALGWSIGEISPPFFEIGVGIIMTYVTFQLPVKPLIPALCEILPQVGTIESAFFSHFGFVGQFVLDAWRRFMS